MRGAAWTFEEIAVLRRHYRAASFGERFASVARLLPGRSKAAIKQKMHLLRKKAW